ncbi:glycosyltransferase [Thomasclavelia cocleata]|uniref:glycosyltransferase n=1 Tax=Thomasclavelia cocleata TaxID=69824 RepID=UPI002558190A|nr:glycosyltransferase [Thomasclavelia cocleata]
MFHQENKGVCVVRNKGMEIDTSEYTMFIDSDDIVLLNVVETMINLIGGDKTYLVISVLNFVYSDHIVLIKRQ